jgi:hypothetical protein
MLDSEKNKTTRVCIYHISTVDDSQFESILDLGLDFIWKTMHCDAIRLHVLH